MSAIMSDVIEGSITPVVANASVQAGRQLLKVVELQAKYGAPQAGGGKVLALCGGPADAPADSDPVRQRIARLQEELAELQAKVA